MCPIEARYSISLYTTPLSNWLSGFRDIFFSIYYPHAFLKKRRGYCNRLRPSVCLLCYLLLNYWTKFNQIWCATYSHEWGVQQLIFFAPTPGALGRGQKVKYHLISITKSISKIFIPNFVCALTNERYKTYQTGFSFCRLGIAPGVGLRGAGGAQGGKKCLSIRRNGNDCRKYFLTNFNFRMVLDGKSELMTA